MRYHLQEYEMIKQKIVRQLKTLNNTLDNLLNWALTQTTSAIEPVPEKLNLCELVENNVKLFEALIEEKKLSFQYHANGFVYADPNHVNVVIRNLLLNAIKFSFDNGTYRNKKPAARAHDEFNHH
jgi:two-component system sensor histidine kinase/response regulator